MCASLESVRACYTWASARWMGSSGARPTRGSTSSGPWLRSRYSACAYSRERQRVGSGHDYVGEEGMLFR